ncbi:TPA: hypothetical protein JLH60_004749 [Escherichia coli]|nr:hypothetical protein [Escherichia coli]
MIKGQENLIPGQGRPKGVPNKATIERTIALREWLMKKDIAYKFLSVILERLENTPEQLKTADLIKGFQMIQPHLFKTIAEEEATARLDQILDNENPAQMKADILEFVSALKVVG